MALANGKEPTPALHTPPEHDTSDSEFLEWEIVDGRGEVKTTCASLIIPEKPKKETRVLTITFYNL